MLKTRFTELLNVDYPIECGCMMHISDAEFVASCANAGIFTCLASGMYTTEEQLGREISRIKNLTDKPFGINISLFPGLVPLGVEQCLQVISECGVRVVETSGGNPTPHRSIIKEKGFLHIHKCARVRDAVKAESVGVDMVAVVGTECGGHPSKEDVGSLVLIPAVAEKIHIPLIAGGGFCDGKSLVAALALGADAVVMGTRFLLTEESRIHPFIKENLIQAREADTVVIQKSIGSPKRVHRNRLAEKVLEMERDGATLEALLPLISGTRAKEAWFRGSDEAVFSCGQAVGRVKMVQSIRDVTKQIMSEAVHIIDRLHSIKKSS